MLIVRRAVKSSLNEPIELVAFPAVELQGVPGWLTGESAQAQGIETTLPNLPTSLALPGTETTPFACAVDPLSACALRIRIGPAGHRVFSEPVSWLGIVIDDQQVDDQWQVDVAAGAYQASSPQCRITVGLDPFTLKVFDLAVSETNPVLRTGERLRQVAGFPMAPPVLADEESILLNLELAPDEDILGFGEQFGRLVKNGQELRLHTDDALGTGTGLAYKPVPVWHSTAGYLGLLNTGAVIQADVGHARPSVLSIRLDDQALDLIVVVSADPKRRLAEYTRLTGTAPQPPLWALGYWMGRCRYHSSEEMLGVADAMRSHAIPADVLHCDPDWLVLDRLNTDFIWNEDRFGTLAGFCSDLADRGFRLSVWEVPYIDPRSPVHQEAERAGYLVRTPDGALAELSGTPTPEGLPRALIDFTNPDAARWWQDKHEGFLDAGVAVFKTDFGEGCPNGMATSDGTPSNYTHNLYPLRYNRTVSNGIARFTGRNPLVWGRSAWAGSHRYPGQWGGDAESTVAGMQATLRGGLSYAMCAPGHWSHDIGGFYGPELTAELYVRWTQFGAFSPLMRAHGLRPREPWQFGEEALDICRDWIRLRYSLLPYLWQLGKECETKGLPILRPMALEFPDDPACRGLDDQYMFGSSLLVVPVFDDAPEPVRRRFYLPAGQWHDLSTREAVTGPGFISRDVTLREMPVFVRGGSVVPRAPVDEGVRCAADVEQRPWTVHVYGDVADDRVLWDFENQPVELGQLRRNAGPEGWQLEDFGGAPARANRQSR